MKGTLGGILLAIGILIACGSGLCSLAVLFTPAEYSGFSMWPAVLTFGGIPFAIGMAAIFGGRSLIRSARNQPDHDTTFE